MCERQRNIGGCKGRGKESKIPLPEGSEDLVRDQFPIRIAAERGGVGELVRLALREDKGTKRVVGIDA